MRTTPRVPISPEGPSWSAEQKQERFFCTVCRSKTVRDLHLTALLLLSLKKDKFHNPIYMNILGSFLYEKYFLAFE